MTKVASTSIYPRNLNRNSHLSDFSKSCTPFFPLHCLLFAIWQNVTRSKQFSCIYRDENWIYLNLIHVHNNAWRSLCPQSESDPFIQSHAEKLTVVSCVPSEKGNKMKKILEKCGSSKSLSIINTIKWIHFMIASLCVCYIPVVSSVDCMYDVRLNQASILLTVPASRGPTCTAGQENRK